MSFAPDYRNLVMSAKNIEAPRLPLYEHFIDNTIMEAILGQEITALENGGMADKREFMRRYCQFFLRMGYDTVSFERVICGILPGGGALYHQRPGCIRDREDFERYPWDQLPELFFAAYGDYFALLPEAMPPGMRAVGGPGNGLFEMVQDLVGYESLCYILADDEELFSDLFLAAGRAHRAIWERFLSLYGESYCVCRFGDDMGFRSATLLDPDDLRTHIIARYRPVIDLVHRHKKPFLLHSCGAIWPVMEDVIAAGIDAKHSNEDGIAPFPVWVERYGNRIGNFGGIDTDAVCRLNRAEMTDYITEVVAKCKGHGGFAFGSGNSIASYVPVESFINMTEIVRALRRES